MANIKGAGGFFTRETDGTLRLLRTAAFQISSETESTDVQAFPYDNCGPLQIVDSFISSTTWTLTTAPRSIDKTDLELIVDKKFGTATSIVLPEPIGVFDIAAGGVVTVTGLAAADVASITILDDTAGNAPILPADFTKAANQITIGAGVVTANNAVGKKAAVYRRKTNANIKVIGGNTPVTEIGEIEVGGLFCTTRGNFKFWAPRCKRSNGVEFAVDSDEFSLEYKMLVPTALGWASEFAIW